MDSFTHAWGLRNAHSASRYRARRSLLAQPSWHLSDASGNSRTRLMRHVEWKLIRLKQAIQVLVWNQLNICRLCFLLPTCLSWRRCYGYFPINIPLVVFLLASTIVSGLVQLPRSSDKRRLDILFFLVQFMALFGGIVGLYYKGLHQVWALDHSFRLGNLNWSKNCGKFPWVAGRESQSLIVPPRVDMSVRKHKTDATVGNKGMCGNQWTELEILHGNESTMKLHRKQLSILVAQNCTTA